MKIQSYGQLFFAVALVGVWGVGCSHSEVVPPYDSVTVDRSNPEHTTIVLNGACAGAAAKEKETTLGKKGDSVTQGGKTYYFSSIAERDQFLQNYMANSRY